MVRTKKYRGPDLFDELKPKPPADIFFKDLDPMEKINYRANSCGFNTLKYKGNNKYIPINTDRRHNPWDRITQRYHTFYKMNWTISYDTLRFIKNNKQIKIQL